MLHVNRLKELEPLEKYLIDGLINCIGATKIDSLELHKIMYETKEKIHNQCRKEIKKGVK